MQADIERALTQSGIPAAVEAAKHFLTKIAGPAAEEFGLFLGDKVRMWRVKNATIMLAKAQRMLKDSGIEPSSVPLKTLVPLFEGASLEEDEELATKWAALLANAASPECSLRIHPGFAQVLSQLPPTGARFLDEVAKAQESYLRESELPRSEERIWVAVTHLIRDYYGDRLEDFDVMAGNLQRLGLCEIAPPSFKEHTEKGESIYERDDHMQITRFGFQFVMACCFPATKPRLWRGEIFRLPGGEPQH